MNDWNDTVKEAAARRRAELDEAKARGKMELQRFKQAERERKEQAKKPKRNHRDVALRAHPAYWHWYGDVLEHEPYPTVRHKRPWLPTINVVLPHSQKLAIYDHPAIALGHMRPGATYHQLIQLFASNADVRAGIQRTNPPAADQHAAPSPDWQLPPLNLKI